MAVGTLEHVNISVSDPDRIADLLCELAGWRRRWEGPALNDGRTIHCGNDNAYVALYHHPDFPGPFEKGAPLQHIGIAVDDIRTAEATVIKAGLKPFNHRQNDPGPFSFYLFDWDGIEWEVASYS